MNIEADAMRYDDLKQTSVFTGNVVVNKGTIQIRGTRIDVRQDPEGYQYGVVTAEPGKLAFYRQKREGVDEFIEGEGETIEYDGKADVFVPKVFQAIHKDRQNLTGDAAILAWVEKQPDLDSKKFAELFKSFSVAGKAKRAAQLTNDYQVAGVPALGVAGRWYVDGDTAGSLDRALQVVDFLVAEARKA